MLRRVKVDNWRVTECSLCFNVSTECVMSTPLQLGARLLLSRAANLCPGVKENWRKELQNIDTNFVLDMLLVRFNYSYKEIVLMPRSIMEMSLIEQREMAEL